MVQDPTNPEEWQEAVNAADWCLLLDAARLYGLVSGGPEIDVARAEQVLERGAGLGIKPNREWMDEK